MKRTQPCCRKIDGIIFGETGVHFSYQLGIIKYIQKTFDLTSYKFCGISGGCHGAFILSNEIDVDHFFNQFVLIIFNDKHKNQYTSVFDISKIALYKLYRSICDLQHMNNKMYISMTKLFPYWHNHTVSKFRSYNDMFNSIKSSQYIPFLFGHPYTIYNDEKYIDGYMTSIFDYKPTNEHWVSIKIWNFSFYYFITSILNLQYLFDETYHQECYTNGFNDAKKKHDYFLKLGFTPICIHHK